MHRKGGGVVVEFGDRATRLADVELAVVALGDRRGFTGYGMDPAGTPVEPGRVPLIEAVVGDVAEGAP
ncbi:MAG: hypothetical protein DWQ40_00390 [Actinobacteria bacterium]|nr:MAG: hypothetical protein DWQ40_00390 [Actinomycetota bacterium]REK35572.1 MAG: hypothetical protein DWQ20_05995 [Actinomycetota bacterium]